MENETRTNPETTPSAPALEYHPNIRSSNAKTRAVTNAVFVRETATLWIYRLNFEGGREIRILKKDRIEVGFARGDARFSSHYRAAK